MARFSDLPAEAILEIWGYVHDPHSIENFALVSKGIYALSGPYVQEHHRLRARFSVLESYPEEAEESALAAYTKHFILNPIHALYVTEVRLSGLRTTWDNHDVGLRAALNIEELPRWHQPYCKADAGFFAQAIKNCEWTPEEERHAWVKAMEDGEEDPILALLVTKVPNIQKMTLETSPTSYGNPFDCFCRIVEHIAESPSSACLSRLKEVMINQYGLESSHGLKLMNVCGALPSITSLDCYQVCMPVEHKERLGFNPMSLHSNLKHLSFQDCQLNDRLLFESLEKPKSLKTFAYRASQNCLGELNYFFIRASLLTHARHTLETLVLSSKWSNKETYMGSIRGFVVLKKLVTDCTSLLGRMGYDGPYTSYFTDTLPDSIEDVRLDENNHTLDAISLVEDLIEAKKAGLFSYLQRFDLVVLLEKYWHTRLLESLSNPRAIYSPSSQMSMQMSRSFEDIEEWELSSSLGRLEKLALKVGLHLRITIKDSNVDEGW